MVLFAKDFIQVILKDKSLRLENWINKLQSRGRIAFSLQQLKDSLPTHSDVAIKRALDRLSKKGSVLSIHKGYYLIIPPQYASRGILPVNIFIDGLMKYLGRPYYVGLLSAAAMHGAAHQQPQEFYVITTSPALRPTEKKNIRINYITRNKIPENYLEKKKNETGYFNISSSELTAIDLFIYEKRTGGLNRIGTVLNELIDEFNKEKINQEFIHIGSTSAVQRLGYMLEYVIEGKKYADKLYEECLKANLKFNRIPLEGNKETKGFSSSNRWNIIVNANIEIDE